MSDKDTLEDQSNICDFYTQMSISLISYGAALDVSLLYHHRSDLVFSGFHDLGFDCAKSNYVHQLSRLPFK